MGHYININGTDREMTPTKIYVDGSWRDISAAKIYVNDIWKDISLCGEPQITFIGNDGPIMQFDMVQISATVNDAVTEFEWDFGGLCGGGDFCCWNTDTLTPSCFCDITGDFTVTFTARNDCGDEVSDTTIVEVVWAPH